MEALTAIRFLGSVLAPPRCAICGRPCASAETACTTCASWLAADRGATATLLDGLEVDWAAPYEGPARGLVAALKFGGRVRLARTAAVAIARGLAEPTDGVTVVAVPASPVRRRSRGFDPAEAIAVELAHLLGAPLARPLVRAHGPRQVGRGRRERLAAGPAVRVVGPIPDRLLLVDDVLTTGATLAACVRTLRAAGATELRAAVFARAL